jgi:hypothetical protein
VCATLRVPKTPSAVGSGLTYLYLAFNLNWPSQLDFVRNFESLRTLAVGGAGTPPIENWIDDIAHLERLTTVGIHYQTQAGNIELLTNLNSTFALLK